MAAENPLQEALFGHLIAGMYLLILSIAGEFAALVFDPLNPTSRAIVLGASPECRAAHCGGMGPLYPRSFA